MADCTGKSRGCGGGLFGGAPPLPPPRDPLLTLARSDAHTPISGKDGQSIEKIVSAYLDAELPSRCVKIIDHVMNGVLSMMDKHKAEVHSLIFQEVETKMQQKAKGDSRIDAPALQVQLQDTISTFTQWHHAIEERLGVCEKKLGSLTTDNQGSLQTHQNTNMRLNSSDALHAKSEERLAMCEAKFKANEDSIRSLETKLILGNFDLTTKITDRSFESQVGPNTGDQVRILGQDNANGNLLLEKEKEKELQVVEDDGKVNAGSAKLFEDPIICEANSAPRSDIETKVSLASVSAISLHRSKSDWDQSQAQQASVRLDYPLEYEWNESTWDLLVFLNLGSLNMPDSVLSAIACTLTVFVQLIFILIVARSMTDDPLSDDHLDELLQWRVFTGHQYERYDPFSDSSLTARVCAGSWTLMLSGTQSSLFENFDSFLGRESTGNFLTKISWLNRLNGIVLCLLCFFLWTLHCQKEMMTIIAFCNGLLARLGPATELDQAEARFLLKSIGKQRFIMTMVLSVLPRSFILGTLYVYGSLFLLYTTALSELLLNALALTFILEIDDLIFEVFAPFSGKAVVKNLEPIYLKNVTRDQLAYKYLDLRSAGNLIVLIAVVVLTYFLVLKDFETHMEQAHELLCGGDRNFVAVQSQATHQVYYMATTDLDSAAAFKYNAPQTYAKEAVSRLANIWNNITDAERQEYTIAKSSDFLHDVAAATSQEAADMYSCYDQFSIVSTAEGSAITSLFNLLLDGENYNTCAAMSFACANHSYQHPVKTICPETCLCKNPSALIFDLSGCPGGCMSSRKATGQEIVESFNCQDQNATFNTTYMGFFEEYAVYLERNGLLANTLQGAGYDDNASLPDLAWTLGCNLTAALKSWGASPDPCSYTDTFGSVNVYCPASCGDNCPPEAAEIVIPTDSQQQQQQQQPQDQQQQQQQTTTQQQQQQQQQQPPTPPGGATTTAPSPAPTVTNGQQQQSASFTTTSPASTT